MHGRSVRHYISDNENRIVTLTIAIVYNSKRNDATPKPVDLRAVSFNCDGWYRGRAFNQFCRCYFQGMFSAV